MKKRNITPILLVLFGLAAASFVAATGVTLRLQPKQGKTYSIEIKANMMTMMEAQGQTMNMSQNMETRQTFTAKEVTEKQSNIETQIDAIKMTISQMGMSFTYDSENPEKTSPMLAGQTQELEKELKKPVMVSYDNLGHQIGDSTDLSMDQLGAAIMELPEKELLVGSTWTATKTQASNGTEFNVDMTYTVTAISKKSVDLTYAGTIDSKSNEVSGSYNGTASISTETGLVTKNTQKQNISMTISEQGMSIPVTIVGTTTIEVK